MKPMTFDTAPKTGEYILVFQKHSGMWATAAFFSWSWYLFACEVPFDDSDFTHWLPMPEIPQDEGDDHE